MVPKQITAQKSIFCSMAAGKVFNPLFLLIYFQVIYWRCSPLCESKNFNLWYYNDTNILKRVNWLNWIRESNNQNKAKIWKTAYLKKENLCFSFSMDFGWWLSYIPMLFLSHFSSRSTPLIGFILLDCFLVEITTAILILALWIYLCIIIIINLVNCQRHQQLLLQHLLPHHS